MGILSLHTDPQLGGGQRRQRNELGQAVMWKEFDLFCHSLGAFFWYIHGVASVAIWIWSKVPSLHSILVKVALVTCPLKNKDFGSRMRQRGLIKINVYV